MDLIGKPREQDVPGECLQGFRISPGLGDAFFAEFPALSLEAASMIHLNHSIAKWLKVPPASQISTR